MTKAWKEIKQQILDSIKFVREEKGFTLISEDWGDPSHKCACAMGCVLIKGESKTALGSSDSAASAAELLGVSEKWVDSFIEGFDDHGSPPESSIPAAWSLGREIAEETKPIEYHKWDGE
jgi:hypothetical protein